MCARVWTLLFLFLLMFPLLKKSGLLLLLLLSSSSLHSCVDSFLCTPHVVHITCSGEVREDSFCVRETNSLISLYVRKRSLCPYTSPARPSLCRDPESRPSVKPNSHALSPSLWPSFSFSSGLALSCLLYLRAYVQSQGKQMRRGRTTAH